MTCPCACHPHAQWGPDGSQQQLDSHPVCDCVCCARPDYPEFHEPNIELGTRAQREARMREFQSAFRATMEHYREWTESSHGVLGTHLRGPGNSFGWDIYCPAADRPEPHPSLGRPTGGWPDAPPLWWLCARLVDERDLVRVPPRVDVERLTRQAREGVMAAVVEREEWRRRVLSSYSALTESARLADHRVAMDQWWSPYLFPVDLSSGSVRVTSVGL